jgi:hypothetical protein
MEISILIFVRSAWRILILKPIVVRRRYVASYFIVGLHRFTLFLTSSETLRNTEISVSASFELKITKVGICPSIQVAGYGLDKRIMGVRFPALSGSYSLLHAIQTGRGASQPPKRAVEGPEPEAGYTSHPS